MNVRSSERRIRFLFLGNPDHDRRLQHFASLFRSKGWSVEIICGVPAGVRPALPNVIPIELQYSRGPGRFIEYHRKLISLLRSRTLTTITFSCDLYSLRAATSTRSATGKVIYDAREIYTKLPSVEGRFASRVWKYIEAKSLLTTDLVVVTAERDVNALLEVHSFLPKTSVVRNIPWQETEAVAPINLHTHFGIDLLKKILVYIGGLQADRGLETILRVVPALAQEVVVVLIGDGSLRSHLEEIVLQQALSTRVFFYGAAASDDGMRLIASADVGLCLIEQRSGSYKLALPSKIFEYLYAGLPVVCSELIAVRDLFHNSEFICFADEHSDTSVVEAIATALRISTQPMAKKQISTIAKNMFSFQQDAEDCYRLIERMLA